MTMPMTPQSGLVRKWQLPGQRYNSTGQLIRGVVVATYVTDDPNHPEAPAGDEDQRTPTAVYCDVLCYSSLPGLRYVALTQVLVLQGKGLHDGRIWKPRAATFDITGDSFDVDGPTEIGNMDGDHVLIGFIEGNPNEPVILGPVPHPSRDVGAAEGAPLGRRLKLVLADGDPDIVKHHGSFYGIDNEGNAVLDTTHANDGTLLDTDAERGFEPPQPTDGKGAQRYYLPHEAERTVDWVDYLTDPENPAVIASGKDTRELRERKVQNTGTVIDELLDYADPNAPESKAHAKLTETVREILLREAGSVWRVILEDGANTLRAALKDADATLTVGDGAVAVAIADHLETLYTGLTNALQTWETHTHPTGVGPSGPAAIPINAPAWDGAIASTKVTIPDG